MPVTDIAAMMTSPDPGAAVGAKAIAAVGECHLECSFGTQTCEIFLLLICKRSTFYISFCTFFLSSMFFVTFSDILESS